MSGWIMKINEFFKVLWCTTVDTLIGQETDLAINPESNREPVEFLEDGCDVLKFAHPHQDPGSAILDVLQSLHAPARDPNEE